MAVELEYPFESLQRRLLAEIRDVMAQHEKKMCARIEELHQQQEMANKLQQQRMEDSMKMLHELMKNEPIHQNSLSNTTVSKVEAPIPKKHTRPIDNGPTPKAVPSQHVDPHISPYAPAQQNSALSNSTQNEEDVKMPSRDNSISHIHTIDSDTCQSTLTEPLIPSPSKRPSTSEMKRDKPSFAQRLINHPLFDAVMGVAILGNTVFIGYSAEYAVKHYTNPTNKFIDQGEWFFCILFTIEVTVRLIALKPWMFFCGEDCWWNLFDLTLVTTTLWTQVQSLQMVDSGKMPNTMSLRVLRLLRLLKMFRVVRIARFMRELRTMITSIVGSMRTLFWSMVMMTLILYIFGLVFLQAATAALPEESLDDVTRRQLLQYFGSVYRSMLTLYMATTGGEDWGPMASPLVSTGAGYYYLFLFYISFLSMAILNVVMGLFVDAAMKATEKDRIEALKEAAEDHAGFQDNIIAMFKEYDTSGDGLIDQEELAESYSHPKMLAFMQHLDISDTEVTALYELLDKSGTGVPVKELVQGCFRVSRGAKSIDIMQLVDLLEALRVQVASLGMTLENGFINSAPGTVKL